VALSATPYKVNLDISNVDRNVYQSIKVTVARHPSETALRMVARILAYGIFYHPQLAFGRGLSETDEAALWQLALTGDIDHWIDVGQPDADRIIKSSRRAPQLSVLVYGNARIWAEKTLPKVSHLKNTRILALPETDHLHLADSVNRNIHWGLMISDGILYVSHAEEQTELKLETLL